MELIIITFIVIVFTFVIIITFVNVIISIVIVIIIIGNTNIVIILVIIIIVKISIIIIVDLFIITFVIIIIVIIFVIVFVIGCIITAGVEWLLFLSCDWEYLHQYPLPSPTTLRSKDQDLNSPNCCDGLSIAFYQEKLDDDHY